MRIEEEFKLDHSFLFKLLCLFLLSRFFFFIIGLSPNQNYLPQMWQLLSPDLLSKDYFKSLLYLHSQPPIWNSIFGIFIKIFGTDYKILNIMMHLFNIFCSFIITIYFFLISREFNFNKKIIYVLFFIFIGISPPLLMYENFIHYTNLTVLLFMIVSYNFIRFGKTSKFIYEVKVYLYLILLMYTWSAFSHPAVIVGIFFIIFFSKQKKKNKKFFFIYYIISYIFITIYKK